MMKLIVGIISLAIYGSYMMIFPSHTKSQSVQSIAGIGVVELFTSEGCSSCPPADQAVADLALENKPSVYILCYHVDYWDRLGWKDAFSSAAFTSRQKEYAEGLRLNTIYTPQIVVNGTAEFVGSDRELLHNSLQKELTHSSTNQITISCRRIEPNQIAVEYRVQNGETNLHIALVQPSANVAVKAGENGGKSLHHINIVRDFKTISIQSKLDGEVQIAIPDDIKSNSIKLIAFTQSSKTLRITGATETALK